MFLKKISTKFHSVLFPSFNKTICRLENECSFLMDEKDRLSFQIDKISSQLKQKQHNTPMMSDLMRETLGLVTVNFSNVQDDGVPRHFLDVENKDKRTQYINELHQIFQYEVWEIMCRNHIDTQGNFSLRSADGELQILAGRMSINGISILRNDVRKGHEEYMERSKPPEEFDEFETNEGIIINKSE